MKKKLLAIVLAIVLILTNAVTIYAATEDTVTASSDKTELKVGETFSITLEVSAPSGVAAVSGFSYSYDTEKLELENETITSTFMSVVENDVRVLMYIGEQTSSVEMATLTFSVKEGVEAGTTTSVNFGEMVVASIDNPNVSENTPVSIQPISITVIEETTPPGDGEGEGDGGGEQEPPTECDHTYEEIEHNDTEHWNVCSKCNEEESGSREAHNYSYTDNENGTHTATCTVCGYKISEEHEFDNGECNDCDAVESTDDECEHTYVSGSNDTQHWEACSKCGQIKSGTLKTHTYDSYKNNNDGTHTAKCSECGHEHKESHATNAACDKCGYTPTPTGNNGGGTSNGGNSNGGNNNSSDKDNTVADKEIPKAGLNVMILLGIVSIVVVAVVMYIKNQKYQDIK